MRITTQMLNASAKRAGISLGGTSLLNYINNGSTQSMPDSLLNPLNTRQNTAVRKMQSENYEKLEKNAEALSDSLQVFLEDGEESVFQTVGEERKKLSDTVKKMVENYNSTIKALKKTSNPLNDFYHEMLKETVAECEEGLEAVGITQDESGLLRLDEEKIEAADLENVKSILGGNGTFTSKAAFIASRISDNAQANAESCSSQYGADGYSYVTNTSKYDFWG